VRKQETKTLRGVYDSNDESIQKQVGRVKEAWSYDGALQSNTKGRKLLSQRSHKVRQRKKVS